MITTRATVTTPRSACRVSNARRLVPHRADALGVPLMAPSPGAQCPDEPTNR
jgi:hypothetical protein